MNPQDPIVPSPPPAAPPPPAPAPAAVEDAGSQALTEALSSSFFIVKIIMAGLVLVFLGSGFFTVGPQEKAVILRLGKPVGEGDAALLGPGLHWAFPRPIDEVEHVPFTSVQNAESSVGWDLTPAERAKNAAPPNVSEFNPASITYALTADTNIIHVMATVKYSITDPIAFHFKFVDAPTLITNALNNALLFVSSQMKVDDILTRQRIVFREQVTERAKALIDSEKLGVTVNQLDVEARPPQNLRPKFDEVDEAMIKRDTMIAEAQSYATTKDAGARAEATNRVYVADAQRRRLVELVKAQADTFLKLRGQYERDPAFFERVRQMAVLEEVYTNAQQKIILPPHTKELRLELSREPEAPSTNNIITAP
jgi:membrane protease subunit HflK